MSSSLIPDGAPLAYNELPSGFWGDPDEELHAPRPKQHQNVESPARSEVPSSEGTRSEGLSSATYTRDGLSSAESSNEEASGTEHADLSQRAAAPASPLSAAFEQLVSLFPGRVLEVISPTEESGASVEAGPSPLDDELLGSDGYDDDDQDRLSFGPSREI